MRVEVPLIGNRPQITEVVGAERQAGTYTYAFPHAGHSETNNGEDECSFEPVKKAPRYKAKMVGEMT